MDPRLALNIASAAAGLFALCRLFYTHANRSYPWFAVYLAAAALQSFVWLAGGPADHRYVLAWASSTAILLGLRIVIAIELWLKMMPAYRSVEALSKGSIWIVIALALAVSAASGLDTLRFHGVSPQRVAFYCISLAARYSGSSLCVVCSCLCVFAMLFPRSVPRNAVKHAFLLTAYFATIAAGYLAMHFDRGSAPLVGALMTGSSAGLYVLWGTLLSQPGERVPARLSTLPQVGFTS
jgi:hypothetical protein